MLFIHIIEFSVVVTLCSTLALFGVTIRYNVNSIIVVIPIGLELILLLLLKLYEFITDKIFYLNRLEDEVEHYKELNAEGSFDEDILDGYKTFKDKELDELKKKYQ